MYGQKHQYLNSSPLDSQKGNSKGIVVYLRVSIPKRKSQSIKEKCFILQNNVVVYKINCLHNCIFVHYMDRQLEPWQQPRTQELDGSPELWSLHAIVTSFQVISFHLTVTLFQKLVTSFHKIVTQFHEIVTLFHSIFTKFYSTFQFLFRTKD